MRLDKYLCSSTEYTRAMAKRAIGKGQVTINDQTVTNPATKVDDQAIVTLGGQTISIVGNRYILLHKPVDFICSTVDESHPSVINLVDVEKRQLLHIAGRLDADTTGLVLITDDGKWSHAITSPKRHCKKRYRAELSEAIEPPEQAQIIEQFKTGIQLNHEIGLTRPATLEFVSPFEVLLTINEGKYHQVKRMFAAIGNKVVELHREAIGAIELGDLELGDWRHLTEQEVKGLDG